MRLSIAMNRCPRESDECRDRRVKGTRDRGGSRRELRRSALGFGPVLTLLLGGCSLMVDPYHDEYVTHPTDTGTASVNEARAAAITPALRDRGHAPTERSAESGTVTHGPLYFEDPFEDKGSEDGQFAWTGEDYLQMFYWRARFLLNGIALPVSAVVTPPWTVMASDGELSRQALGYDHDAERAGSSCEQVEAASESHENTSAGG